MDIKKWAGSRLGFGNVVPVPTDPTGPVMPPQGGASASKAPGMYGAPGSKPLFNTDISSDDLPPTMAQWATAGGTAPEHPQGPVPPWAADQGAFQHALALVKKNWEEYEEPWAVVGLVYDAMATAAPKPAAAPGMPPKAPAPPGAPAAPKPNPFAPGGAPKAANPFAPGGAKPNPFGGQ